MSLNIFGTRNSKINETVVEKISYTPWKTSELTTDEILASINPIEAYKSWVLSTTADVIENTYANDDPTGEGPPISFTVINIGKAQCEHLDKWLEMVTNLGYIVQVTKNT